MKCDWCSKEAEFLVRVSKIEGQPKSKWGARAPCVLWAVLQLCEKCLPFLKEKTVCMK